MRFGGSKESLGPLRDPFVFRSLTDTPSGSWCPRSRPVVCRSSPWTTPRVRRSLIPDAQWVYIRWETIAHPSSQPDASSPEASSVSGSSGQSGPERRRRHQLGPRHPRRRGASLSGDPATTWNGGLPCDCGYNVSMRSRSHSAGPGAGAVKGLLDPAAVRYRESTRGWCLLVQLDRHPTLDSRTDRAEGQPAHARHRWCGARIVQVHSRCSRVANGHAIMPPKSSPWSRRSTVTAFRRATHSTRSASPPLPSTMSLSSHGFWSHSPCWSQAPGSSSDCTIRATSWSRP
jgi:hypothetical protein